MTDRLQLVPPPPFVQRIKDESRAIERASLEAAFDGVPQRDLDRLREQLSPLLNRPAVFPDDRNAITRLIQEWQMRGHPVPAFNSMYDIVWEDQRAEREAKAAPRRRELRERYAEMYAPLNPGLNIVGRPSPPLADCLNAWLRGGTPDRPAPTLTDKFYALLRGTAPRR